MAAFQSSQATEFKARLRERADQLRSEMRGALDKSAEETAERCIRCQELFEKTHATQSTPSL